jgi:hypothetical protein
MAQLTRGQNKSSRNEPVRIAFLKKYQKIKDDEMLIEKKLVELMVL